MSEEKVWILKDAPTTPAFAGGTLFEGYTGGEMKAKAIGLRYRADVLLEDCRDMLFSEWKNKETGETRLLLDF